MSKVFISYSHDSPEHSEKVLALACALRRNGSDVELDQFHNEEIIDWPRWCNEQISPEHSDFVLCVCTAEYRHRIEGKVPPEKGKGVYWEGSLLDDDIYDNKGNGRIIPVLLDQEPGSSIPRFLRGWTHCRMGQFTLGDRGYEHLVRILTRQSRVERNSLGPIPVLSTNRTTRAQQPSAEIGCPTDISRILKYAPVNLIGREEETKSLNDAWDRVLRGDKGRPHILTFVAPGGEGKTSLVAKWAAELAAQDWPSCDAAFAWSFYSQGLREQTAASSDLFLKEALTFFGDEGDKVFAASNAGAFEKGQRLARLVGQQRSLLILDGLDPLQYAPTAPTPGELKDQGVAVLLKGLAAVSRGLCMVTTRYSLPDLKAFWQTTAREVKLLRLSRDAGVHLLKTLGVRGTAQEFEDMVEDVRGHALTLTLLGAYLHDAHEGDIRRCDLVKLEETDAEEQGGHAFRVMAAYERALENEGDKGKRGLAILRLLGLFDRPVTAKCLAALLKVPAILGLTEPLVSLTEAQLNVVLTQLESAQLITVNRGPSAIPHSALRVPQSLDAHPLLREYFARQLRAQQPLAWRAAHRRLYEHLCASTPDRPQPTLEDLQPLYQAVAHGCQAELYEEAMNEVYLARILRGVEQYSWRKLGSFGNDLSAIGCFFNPPWSRLASTLRRSTQAFLLSQAALYLHALGRLTEALEPMRVGVQAYVHKKNWKAAAVTASNLSELEVSLGDLSGAVDAASQAVVFADRSGEVIQRTSKRTRLADALHQAGRRSDALAQFREAEAIQATWRRQYPLLYSLQGFLYCDLLLSEPERAAWRIATVLHSGAHPGPDARATLITRCSEVEQRGAVTLKWLEAGRERSLLDLALNHLTLGRAALYRAILEPSPFHSQNSESRPRLTEAVDCLRLAGDLTYLSRGLLSRAWLRVLTGDGVGAGHDLDEAWEIAERGPMWLHMADIHLHRARLFRDKCELQKARGLIEKCGYLRRKEELADAEVAAEHW
jgi:tetratricopeptide (TPR) repeat protein